MQLLMRFIAPLDRFNQRQYMKLLTSLLRRRGVLVSTDALWISPTTYFDISAPGAIEIGKRSVISHYVRILTHDFSLDRTAEMKGLSDLGKEGVLHASVKIGDYCFIGMGAILLPGVTIGDGAIVAAHGVVTRDVSAGTVVAGNPAREISTTDSLFERRWQDYSMQLRRR